MSELVEHITDARSNGTINVYAVRYNQRDKTDNVAVALLDYSIYECTGIDAITKKEYLGIFYFLIKGKSISNKCVIKYKNINSHVIRLNQYSGGNSH